MMMLMMLLMMMMMMIWYLCVCILQPLNQDSSTVVSRRSSRGSASSDRSGRERRLYRQGSIGSQIGGSGIELGSLGSQGNFSYKSRTPSGKSIRSRVATRAEYHEDLKPQLEQVCFVASFMRLIVCLKLPYFCGMFFLQQVSWTVPVLFLQIRSEIKLLCFILLLRELLDATVVYATAILSVPVTLMISI